MSYADRLNNFNSALDSAKGHIQQMKETLSNPELRENPVRFGLDAAGQVLGTGEGLVRIRAMMKSDDVQRDTANAFFNRLGELKQGNQSLSNSVGSTMREALQNASGRAQQTLGSASADAQPARLTQTVRNITENRTIPTSSADPSSADIAAEDGGISDRIGGFPQSIIRASDEANEINNSINSKIRGGLNTAERSNINSVANESLGDFNEINRIPVGQGKADALKGYLTAKNNIANDVLARKTQGLSAAKGYDTTGKPLGEESSVIGAPKQGAGVAARADATGGASAGSNSSGTVAQGAGVNPVVDDIGADAGGDASNVGVSAARRVATNAVGDIQDAGQGLTATIQDGSNILARGNALNLIQSAVPGRGGVSVPGLSTAGTSGGDSNMVSALQHLNAANAQNAQASGGQTAASQVGNDAGARSAQAARTGANADADASNTGARGLANGSNAAATADEEGANAGRGLKAALGTEETLDALAPDTGPLAPILEAGSLLATLGTSIASIFEPEEKKTAPPPTDPSVGGFSIGASLKGDASGSVGAF